MPQPYQYLMNVEDPTKAILSGLQAGVSIRDLQRQQEERAIKLAQTQRAEQQALSMQAELAEISKNPTPSALASAMVKYPQLSEQFKRTYDVLNSEQKQARLSQASQVYAALQSGKPEIAIDYLGQQAAAYRNSGDEQGAKTMDDMAKIIEASPDTAKTSTGLFLSSAMGPEKFADTYSTLEKEQREKELLPSELEKRAADVGLSKAQAKQALANAEKLSAESQKLIIDAEAAKAGKSPLDPKDRASLERNLANDYTNQAKVYLDTQDAFRRIKAAEDTAPGDLSLIFNYMKMLDPGSVVREGEFASAQNAAGVPTRITNIYNNLLTGKRLDQKQRNEFKSQAASLLKAAGKRESEVRDRISSMASRYDLDPSNILPRVEPESKYGTTVVGYDGQQGQAAPAAETRNVTVDY